MLPLCVPCHLLLVSWALVTNQCWQFVAFTLDGMTVIALAGKNVKAIIYISVLLPGTKK